MRLERILRNDDGTFGRLIFDGLPRVLHTLEEEWLDNEVGESSIPAGTYICRRTIYYRYGYETFEVTDVPSRSHILFHPGNTEEDTQGCILVGLASGPLLVFDEETGIERRKLAVFRSLPAFRLLMHSLKDIDDFELEIVPPQF